MYYMAIFESLWDIPKQCSHDVLSPFHIFALFVHIFVENVHLNVCTFAFIRPLMCSWLSVCHSEYVYAIFNNYDTENIVFFVQCRRFQLELVGTSWFVDSQVDQQFSFFCWPLCVCAHFLHVCWWYAESSRFSITKNQE